MAQVSVSINGKTFRMACDDGEEDRVTQLAVRVDGVIRQLRDDFGEIGDQRLTVMASIMLADDLTEMERRIRELELHREHSKAALMEAATGQQREINALKAAHQSELAALTEQIDAMTQRVETLSRMVSEPGG